MQALTPRLCRNFLLCLCAILLPLSLYGQFETATVLGTVRDSSDAVVPDADVTLHNVESGTDMHRHTNGSGSYVFPGVQVGTYTIIVRASGFRDAEIAPFAAAVAARQRIDVLLAIGSSTETVTVTEHNLGLQTDTSDRSTVIERDQVLNLPLNGREYSDLALLTPGVQVGAMEDGSVQQRRSSIVVNGNRSTSNNFLLDGLDNNSYQINNMGYNNQALAEPVEAVAEYRVTTSNFPAEYGRAGGAVVNVSTRSGSEQFHGSLFEFIRNTALNAYGPFFGTGVKPTLVQNQFGGSLGGPMPFMKSFFFFVDYEGFRSNTHAYSTPSLPTADQRNGIFYNENGAAIPLKNPYTGAAYNNGKVDMTQATPFARQVLNALPLPNLPGFSSNYAWTAPGTNNHDIGDLRLDKYFGDRIHSFLRFSKQSQHIMIATSIPTSLGSDGGHVRVLTSAVAGGLTYVVSPNAVLDTRFGLVFTESGRLPYNYGQTSIYTQLGIPYPIDPGLGEVPLNTLTLRGFNALGPAATVNQFANPHTLDPKVSYTLAKRTHSISFGYEYMHLHEDVSVTSPGYGHNTYNGNFSQGKTQLANTAARGEAYSLADFIFGAQNKYELSNHPTFPEYWDFHYGYAEDTWKVSRNLMLNYGVRYEFSTPERTTNNQLANFDPITNTLIAAKSGSIYDESLVHPYWKSWAPRFGFSYSLRPNLVFRGGYGISYVQFNRYGGNSDPTSNGPYSIDTTVTQDLTMPMCPNGSSSLTCFRTTMQGYPASMIAPAAFSTLTAQTSYVPPDFRPGYVQSFSLGTQVQIDPSTVIDIAYVGNHAAHLLVNTDYNQATLQASGGAASLQSRRPIANFTDIISSAPIGFLRYDSLQAQIRRNHRGVFLLNSFTWSKAFDSASSSDGANGDSQFVNKYCVKCDRGISGYDQRWNDSLGLMWDIPYGKHLHRAVLRQAFGGWSVTSVTRLTAGLPINVTYTPDAQAVDTDLGYGYRPNVTGSVHAIVNPRSKWVKTDTYYGNVFNTAQLSTPADNVLYGNLLRNAVTGPNYYDVDLGLHKTFSLKEWVHLEFRAEAFNLFNHTNLRSPDANMGDAAFGQFTPARGGVNPSRQMQFAMRLWR